MSITAKELAKQLGLSPSAVSIALNNKPGISTETRKKILDAARVSNYDFSKIGEKKTTAGTTVSYTHLSNISLFSFPFSLSASALNFRNIFSPRFNPVRNVQKSLSFVCRLPSAYPHPADRQF